MVVINLNCVLLCFSCAGHSDSIAAKELAQLQRELWFGKSFCVCLSLFLFFFRLLVLHLFVLRLCTCMFCLFVCVCIFCLIVS